MMNIRHKETIVFSFIADAAAMLLAFGVALLLGHRPPVRLILFVHYEWGVLTLIGTVLTLFVILDVYSSHKAPARFTNQVMLMGIGLSISAMLTTFFFFFFRNPVPRAVFILFFFLSWMFITVFRLIQGYVTLKSIYWKILVVGASRPGGEVVRMIRRSPYLHSEIVGLLSNESSDRTGDGVTYLGGVGRLLDIAVREHVDQVIVALDEVNETLMRDLLECMKRTIKVSDFRPVIETISGKVPIEYLSDTWFIEDLAALDKRYFWIVKRLFDICFSVVALGAAFPLLLLIILLIRIDSAGPALYSQERVGRGGRVFRLWKLRTMVRDADKDDVHWTKDNDVRITRCGRVIRKLHIDEIPQLYNVLRGDMSLIGPRPEAVSLVELYKKGIPYYMERHMVSPGLSGWAQVNYRYGNSIDDAKEKLKYDFYYIKYRSVALDILVFLRTIRTVLTGKGAL